MELQALRYAAMIANMTFDKACEYFATYIEQEGLQIDARKTLLDFVDLDESQLDDFGNEVRIVLASADFGKELTTSVLWLRDKGIDISCVRLTPFNYQGEVLIDAAQIIPLEEAEDYQIQFREKRAEQRASQQGTKDYSKYRFNGEVYNKRHLALAVLNHWIKDQQLADLAQITDYLAQLNLARKVKRLDQIPENNLKRWHLGEGKLIELPSGEQIAISNQWGTDTERLLQGMEQLGYLIEKI